MGEIEEAAAALAQERPRIPKSVTVVARDAEGAEVCVTYWPDAETASLADQWHIATRNTTPVPGRLNRINDSWSLPLEIVRVECDPGEKAG